MKSIRAHLVLWLVAALAAGSALVVLLTYGYAHQELDRVFDDELRQIAEAVHLREDWKDTGTVRIARPDFLYAVRAYDEGGRLFFETMVTARPFDAPRSLQPGFSEVESLGEMWRVYTHVTPEGIVQVAQPLGMREALARELSLRMLVPMLLIIPLLGAVVAWVSRRGLAPLEHTSRRVQERDAGRLDPLPTQDVPTELRPLIDALNALLSRLAASMDAQHAFLADAAHELRSPLATIATVAQHARGEADAKTAAALTHISQVSVEASALIGDLLTLAREPRAQLLQCEPLDLAALARHVAADFEDRARERNVVLDVDAQSALVRGDERRLSQLIRNLLDNGLRHAHKRIALRVTNDDSRVKLCVEDDGDGIPEQLQEQIFERAFTTGDGAGIGLAIASWVARAHDGTIRLDRAVPSGTRFEVLLPGYR